MKLHLNKSNSRYSPGLTLLTLSCLCLLVCSAALGALRLRDSITLEWDYANTNQDETLSFLVYTSKDVTLPLTNWGLSTNINASNTFRSFTSTGAIHRLVTPSPYGRMFYTVAASNLLGVSDFSNVTNTPDLPVSGFNLRVK